jgi:hypothetical protein
LQRPVAIINHFKKLSAISFQQLGSANLTAGVAVWLKNDSSGLIIVDAPTIPLAKLEQMVARNTKQKGLCCGQTKRYNVARTRTAL